MDICAIPSLDTAVTFLKNKIKIKMLPDITAPHRDMCAIPSLDTAVTFLRAVLPATNQKKKSQTSVT
jgi:hypothetical protein